VVLEKFETAVEHRWVSVCLKRGTRQFEQDDECVRLMIVQRWVGDKRLQDVIADRGFLHVSEVGPVCDEINVCVELLARPATRDAQITAEESSEGPRAEAALQPRTGWRLIRLHIARETEDQVSGRGGEFTGLEVHYLHPVLPYSIGDVVGGNLMIGLSYIEPEAIEVEGLCIVFVG